MGIRTAVMVFDPQDPKHGELTILSGTNEAARRVEELLEGGVEIERIRVFDATELSMKVVQKPVVSFGADGDLSSAATEAPELRATP